MPNPVSKPIHVIPQTVFTLRGPGGVGKGPLDPASVQARCRGADIAVNIDTNSTVPSTNPREIDILKELLHSVREGVKFYEI